MLAGLKQFLVNRRHATLRDRLASSEGLLERFSNLHQKRTHRGLISFLRKPDPSERTPFVLISLSVINPKNRAGQAPCAFAFDNRTLGRHKARANGPHEAGRGHLASRCSSTERPPSREQVTQARGRWIRPTRRLRSATGRACPLPARW